MSRADTARIIAVSSLVVAVVTLCAITLAVIKTGVVYHIEDTWELTYANPISP